MKQTVTIEDAGPCRKLMKVEVDAGEVAQQLESTTREIQKLARIPGFRPGHAPKPIIEKRFAKEIQAEVRRKTIPESYRQAVSDNKLHVVTMPQIDKVELAKDQPLRYEAKLEVAPEFQLPEYKGIQVKKKSAEVTEEDVTKMIDMLREQRAEFADVTERPLAMGDFAVIRYSAVCEGKPLGESAPNAKLPAEDKDFWLMMDEDSVGPGFCQQLVGKNIGERAQVLVDYPAEFAQAELAGKKVTFFVEVKGIKEKKLPPVDDALAKTFNEESIDSFKAKIKEDVAKQKELSASSEVRNQIVEHLLKSTQFDRPPQLLAEETRGVVYDRVRENMMRGVTKEDIDSKKDEILGFASRSAADRVRAAFILSRIADEEKIKVDKKEIDERIEQMAARYQMPVAKLRAKLEERGGTLEIEEQILRSKTLDFLEASAKVEPA